MAFNYGTEDVAESGGEFKNPEVGDHSARLSSLIHCGLFRESFKGQKKKPCAEVVAVFELKDEEDFEDDGVTPLTIHKAFPVKIGDKTFMTKLLKALDPKGVAEGFDDIIGAPCTVSCTGSKELNDDGSPKYVNFGGLSGVPAKFATLIDPLVEGKSVGHVPFDELTKEAVLMLNPYLEVKNILMEGEKYSGSKAEEVVAEIRKENPDFAKFEDKKEDKKKDAQAKPEVETNLNEEQEF